MADKELGIVYRARGAARVSAASRQVESSITSLHGRTVAFASALKNNVGGALHHFGGRLKEAAMGVAAFAGVGGLLGIAGAVESSVHKIEEFGVALEQVQTLTGETARDSGTLILLFEKFGIGTEQIGKLAGFAEKTLGKLNATTAHTAKAAKSAALAELELQRAQIVAAGGKTKHINLLIKEQKAHDLIAASMTKAAASQTKLQLLDNTYGLQLVDAKGKVVSYSEELRQLAAFYDTGASASTKAYVAAQLLGKGYAVMAPVLAQGSKGLLDAAQAADELGLGSADTVKQINDFRTGMRNLGEQTNLLQMQIGIALLPTLNELATSAGRFVHDNRTDIAAFFKNAAGAARMVVGTIGDLAGTISAFWNAIPPGFRDILVKGIAADRTVKFLFGFSPIQAIAGGLLKGLAGGIFSRGGTPATPLFVADVTGGKGGIPGVVGKGGGGGGLGILGALGIAAIIDTVATEVVGPVVRDWALSHDLAGSGSNAGKTDSQLAYERMHQPGASASTTPVRSGALSVEDRTLREPILRAVARLQSIKDASQTSAAQAKQNAANAKADLTRLQNALAYRLGMANSKLEAIKDKDQSVHLNIRIPTTVNVAARAVNAAQTTFKVYHSGAGGKFQY